MSQKHKTNAAGGSGDGHHSSNENIKKLDMKLLVNYLSTCINKDGTINLEYYIKMYWEINRFFELLGAVFHFVSKDVVAKLLILEGYQKSKHASHYTTIESMIQYEKEKHLLRKTTEPLSGSRTLLRLHRALEFIIEFLKKANSVADDERMCPYAQEAYNTTLANYHPWLIKKAANVAMYSLPYKKDLMKNTCEQKDEELVSLVSEVVDKAREVYDAIQNLYETNNILDLP